jgi:hypothetical protein
MITAETTETYNGWTNRETWNTSLWINNDEGLEAGARDIVRDAIADSSDRERGLRVAEDMLKDWYAETFDVDGAGPVADAWQYALDRTNWREIVEGIAEAYEV